ncbi:hypothetical protein [Yersinia pseudotuberculosis]|uniref:hypothetical protein n=1 Tax=Yersinia pseudotuberculosis TaxID=633 RepID=UPI00034CF8E2
MSILPHKIRKTKPLRAKKTIQSIWLIFNDKDCLTSMSRYNILLLSHYFIYHRLMINRHDLKHN